MSVWNREGIPHKGQKCIDVIDVAEFAKQVEPILYEQCGMCGVACTSWVINEVKIKYIDISSTRWRGNDASY